jgi:opacity protein-like surface antigen
MTIQRTLLVLVSTLALSVGSVATSPVRAGADEPSPSPVEVEPLPVEVEPLPAEVEPLPAEVEPSPAETEPPPAQHDFTRDGWYLQAQGIYAYENFGTGDYDTRGFNVDSTFGFNVEAGYRVAQLFALGAEFEWTNAFGNRDVLAIGTQNVGIPFRLYPLARLFDPGAMANRFQPFIKLAPTWQWAERTIAGEDEDEDKGGFVGRMGGGLDIYLTENVVLVTSALYNWPTGKIDSLGYWSFGGGIQYRFGGGGSGY